MKQIPNLVIFRSEERFFEVELDSDFSMIKNSVQEFDVLPESSYNTMKDTHIVLAEKIDIGSTDIVWYTISDTVRDIPYDDINSLVKDMCYQHMQKSIH